MKYGKAREIIAEARKTFAQRSASLIGRMGGSPEEVRQGITGKRTPAAKGGRALLSKAYKAAEKKRERDPYYPYGKAETRRMSKYMSEAQLDEAAKKKPTKEEKAEAAFQRSLAKLSARNAERQKKYRKAAAANPRANISAHGRPVTKADVAAWHASKPMRSDGLREPYNYMGEAIEQIDELSDSKLRGYAMKSAYNAAVDAPTHGVKKRLKGIGTALKKLAGYRKVNEAQLDELTDAEMEKLEREHEARMAEQERTAYKSPTMRYHLARLRKLAKPAAKKQTKDKRR